MSLDAFLGRTGLTYRQLDYWTRTGRLRAREDAPGTGNPRSWSSGELRVAGIMVRLIGAGFTLQGAHDAARKLTDQPYPEIAPGVTIGISE